MLDVRGIREDEGKGLDASITSSDSDYDLVGVSLHGTPQMSWTLFRNTHLYNTFITKP